MSSTSLAPAKIREIKSASDQQTNQNLRTFFFLRDGLGGNRRKDQTPTGDAWPWKWIVALTTMRHSPENRKERTVRTMGTWCARHSRQTNKLWIEYKYYFNRRVKSKKQQRKNWSVGTVPHRSAIRDGVAPRVILSYARVRLNEEMPDHVRTHEVGWKTNGIQ